MALFDRIADPDLLVRRIYLTANHIVDTQTGAAIAFEQMDLFTHPHKDTLNPEREKRLQQAELQIKKKYGNNAILKGMNLKAGATTVERNRQLGGHKA